MVAIPSFIAEQRGAVAALCERTHARRLALFGSATRLDFQPEHSDLDFLVAFEDMPPGAYSDAYFTLKQGLEELFNRPVDLLTPTALANPFLRERVAAEEIAVYGA